MVGAVAILVLGFDANYFFHAASVGIDFFSVTASIVIAYFLGHIIQAIANVITATPGLKKILQEEKGNYSSEDKRILDGARARFHREQATDAEAFRLCMIFANAHDIADQVKSFNAYYSLCRGWFVVFFLQSLFLIGTFIASATSIKLLLLLLSTAIALLTRRRAKRFWNYFRQKVLETFVVVTATTV